MPSGTPVEIADRYSRKRAVLVAIAAIVFLVGQIARRPFFGGWPGPARSEVIWAINAIVLLAILATGGGLLLSGRIRALMNDEVARSHFKTAGVIGYWVAMTTAMGLYVLPSTDGLSARDAAYVIVTSSIVVPLLAFSYLEYRAHRDA
jgi:hypothetical protein